MTSDKTMVEEMCEAIVRALKADCTKPNGDCYAHGNCDAMEVDGEFDPEVAAQAAATIAQRRNDELYTAAANLRQAQRDYMEVRNGARDEREAFGRAVAEAADKLDDALAAFNGPSPHP